jgi:hypothetical protein
MTLLTLGRADFKTQLHDGVCSFAGDVALAQSLIRPSFCPISHPLRPHRVQPDPNALFGCVAGRAFFTPVLHSC